MFYPVLVRGKEQARRIRLCDVKGCLKGGLRDISRICTMSSLILKKPLVVSYWRKYVHEVLVNRLGGLSLPRKSVVRLTDRPDMTLDVYRGRKTTMQQKLMTEYGMQPYGPPCGSTMSVQI